MILGMSHKYYDLIYELLKKELRVRYKQLTLGYIWSIASPLLYAALYYFVFKIIMKVETENYPIFLICSLFPWQWFSNSVGVGPMTFLGNAPIIKKTLFPRNLISFVAVLQDAIHFAITLPVVLLFLYIFHMTPHWSWLLYLPLLLVVQFAITYSLNLFIATVNLFFRDLERIVQLAMTLLFYGTPVLYNEQLIPEKYQWILYANPMASLMINWRNVFLRGEFNFELYGFTCLWAVALLLISHWVYRKLVWRFAEVL